MFSSLSDSLDKTFRNLRGVGRISEKNISDALREIRIACLKRMSSSPSPRTSSPR
jgi:signal recognition particle subunit SRP54